MLLRFQSFTVWASLSMAANICVLWVQRKVKRSSVVLAFHSGFIEMMIMGEGLLEVLAPACSPELDGTWWLVVAHIVCAAAIHCRVQLMATLGKYGDGHV